MECPLLDLPGELRNRIYNFTVEEGTIRFQRNQEPPNSNSTTKRQFFSLTQVCRSIRSEFSPLYRARTLVSLTPENLYEYISIFLTPPNITDDQITGLITLNLTANPNTTSCIDLKPLLQLLQRAKNLHVGTRDIIDCPCTPAPAPAANDHAPTIPEILTNLYDIHDLPLFYDYVDQAMTCLELECDDEKGVEIVFELAPRYWEDWMGEWSKPDHDPDYRIPIELEERVVRWGRGCGMRLDRSMGSCLTVNFRCGE
ncbi:hypothetical protein EKO04_004118 [Ascochyta lentis]|uniref:F-box domain-containing protein n=1 Tax=Ascochyta lentis TaxID=205686 RepID=A0A8H7MJX2_9PLEO|nr:hypothetical protein EKO04_004118 [Ascochyta lentis]